MLSFGELLIQPHVGVCVVCAAVELYCVILRFVCNVSSTLTDINRVDKILKTRLSITFHGVRRWLLQLRGTEQTRHFEIILIWWIFFSDLLG